MNENARALLHQYRCALTNRKWWRQTHILRMQPPAGHVDELQRVIAAHYLAVTQHVQLHAAGGNRIRKWSEQTEGI